MPWGLKRQEGWKEQCANAMPLSTGAHKIFDAGEAAFLPKQLQAYVAAFELFVARKVKAGQSFSLRDFDLGGLSRIIGHHQAHQLEFILFAGAQKKTQLRISTTDDSLPDTDKSYARTHEVEVDLTRLPNVVEGPVLLASYPSTIHRLLLPGSQGPPTSRGPEDQVPPPQLPR